LANFVGSVVGFLNVCKIRLVASSLPPRYPLKAKWYEEIISFFNSAARAAPARAAEVYQIEYLLRRLSIFMIRACSS
jgi:hypothetical protein